MMARAVIVVLALQACTSEDPPPPEQRPTDTGWFSDTDTTSGEDCADAIVTTRPTADTTDWYWRSAPRVWTDTADHEAYSAYLQDETGAKVPALATWNDSSLYFDMVVEGGLKPNTGYTLHMSDCVSKQELPFHTSEYGEPLLAGPRALTGNTYKLDLLGATWVEPPEIGALMALYFTTPVLLGVQLADETVIDMVGGAGIESPLGGITQDMDESTWAFAPVPFDEAPYFRAEADEVTFSYQGVNIFVSDFHLEGTFSADATTIGGAELRGFGDTREMYKLLGIPENHGAMCEVAASLGVQCEACADGGMYCLDMWATKVDGTLIPGLRLVER